MKTREKKLAAQRVKAGLLTAVGAEERRVNPHFSPLTQHRGRRVRRGKNLVNNSKSFGANPSALLCVLCVETSGLEGQVPHTAPVEATSLAKLTRRYARGLQTLCRSGSIMRQNVSKDDCLPYCCASHNILAIGYLPEYDGLDWIAATHVPSPAPGVGTGYCNRAQYRTRHSGRAETRAAARGTPFITGTVSPLSLYRHKFAPYLRSCTYRGGMGSPVCDFLEAFAFGA